MKNNTKAYTLKDLRELPVGTQVLAEVRGHEAPLWVSLGRIHAVGIIPGDAELTFYAHNGLQTLQLEYCDYGEGWVAYNGNGV